jgi:mediator of RNA polymerase II transcription subunit 14
MDVPAKQVTAPPELPHITTNIVPLSTILRKFAEFSFAELSHVIQIQPSDESKKQKLLELIVGLRKEFIRLYVLTKWSRASAHDFTKFVDILAWLREQSSHFTNLIWSTKSLNQSLLSAKLPNPDLITALEVLTSGRPTLPSHNLIESKISAKKVLQTLQDLNVVLSIKFALVDDLPEDFTDYEIKDGRIYIYTPDYHFQISAVDENGPFFMVDFKFTLGEFEQGRQLMRASNEALRNGGFSDLKKILTNFTLTMKLYLIHKKLSQAKNVKHKYQPDRFRITVHYWINNFVFKYSYVDIGVNRQSRIVYRWFKQGEFIQSFEDVEHIDMLLRDIYHKHATDILSKVEDLTVNKSLLQINELTGFFYFKNSTPSLNNALKKLNVDDFNNINQNLKTIRTDAKFAEIAAVLSVTGWIQNDLIKLPPNEAQKLPNHVFLRDGAIPLSRNLKFYTRKEWPSNWFLILTLDTKIKTYIGRVSSEMGQWSLSNAAESNIESFDYKNSKDVIDHVSKKIMTHLITQELQGVQYRHVSDNALVVQTESFVKIPNASKVVFLAFAVEPNNNSILVKLKGKLNSRITLEDFVVDPQGIFEIFESVNFKRSNILTNIVSKLEKLAKVIELVEYLQLEEMNLVSVKLDQVVFKYGDQLCTLKDNFDMELPKTNPHNICLPSIKRYLITNGVGTVFRYLQNSNTLITKLNELTQMAQQQNFQDCDLNKVRYEVISKNATYFSVLYYSNAKPRKLVNMNIEIKNGGDRKFQYLISFEPIDNRLKQELSFKGSLYGNKGSFKLVPLTNGVICDDLGLVYVIDHLHKKIMELFKSD